MPPPTI